jgi:hypothetical protein
LAFFLISKYYRVSTFEFIPRHLPRKTRSNSFYSNTSGNAKAILVLILLPLSALLGTPVASMRKIEFKRAAWRLFRASEK